MDAQAVLSCRALDFYTEVSGFNPEHLTSCSIRGEECQGISCIHVAERVLIETTDSVSIIALRTNPCGENGRRQGLLVTVIDFTHAVLFNMTFYEPTMIPIEENTFNILVNQQVNGITFEVCYKASVNGNDVLDPPPSPLFATS